jgi:hypothetical protein
VIQSLQSGRGSGPILHPGNDPEGDGGGCDDTDYGDGCGDATGDGYGDGTSFGDGVNDGYGEGDFGIFLACPEPTDLASSVINTLARIEP